MPEPWKVFKCSACKMCHGRKSIGHNCPHCGQRTNKATLVIDSADNPADLRMKVIIANTPPELRESLAKQLQKDQQLIDTSSNFSSAKGLNVLRKSVDSEGKLTLDIVKTNFAKRGFDEDVVAFLEMAEAQGIILRAGEGIWQFLE
ncbi:MAG: hypothetical protein VYC12_05995 [Candidatus Thermoplasmatota archaeon]|nr:hypothetical protein [Candidatus Thermoplasmatota archaeon]